MKPTKRCSRLFSKISGCCSDYGRVQQRWLVVESQARKEAEFKEANFLQKLVEQLTEPTSIALGMRIQRTAIATPLSNSAIATTYVY